MAKRKRSNNDLQNITQKTKDRATRTPLKTNNDLLNITQKKKRSSNTNPTKNGYQWHQFILFSTSEINEYRRSTQKWTIQRNCQHRRRTIQRNCQHSRRTIQRNCQHRRRKIKQKHNTICVGHHYT